MSNPYDKDRKIPVCLAYKMEFTCSYGKKATRFKLKRVAFLTNGLNFG